MKAPRIDLLDALAMPVLACGRSVSPAAALRAIAEGRPQPRRVSATDATLKLAATYFQLLGHLAFDLGPTPEPGRKRFNRSFEEAGSKALPEHLVFASPLGSSWKPALRTHVFLSALPPDFVTELVRLAPPVVAALPDDSSRFAVLGNVLSGFLAAHCLAGRAIFVRRLKASTGPRWTPNDLVTWALPLLAPVVEVHRKRIAQIAPSLEVASLIAGVSRATAARYRSDRA